MDLFMRFRIHVKMLPPYLSCTRQCRIRPLRTVSDFKYTGKARTAIVELTFELKYLRFIINNFDKALIT